MHLPLPPPNFALTKFKNTMKIIQMNMEWTQKIKLSILGFFTLANLAYISSDGLFRTDSLEEILGGNVDGEAMKWELLLLTSNSLEISIAPC